MVVNIELTPIEPIKPEINNKTVPAAKILYRHKDYLDIICEGLMVIKHYERWEEEFKNWQSANDKIPKEIFDTLENLFSKIKTEEIFNGVRGALLEKFVELSVSERFNKPTSIKKAGCAVKIERTNIPSDMSIYKKAFDYAAFDRSDLKSEFYECKASPQSFEKGNIDLFQNLKEHIDKSAMKSCVLGCVSYHNSRSINQDFKRKKFNTENLTIIGNKEIKNL
ncbi:hypothetical protein GPDM_15149 [Planococcus donghaensis MPA1U2]|uniref:Uncharacterized protein n=1 Tax=Planococcus donghaensis MPA1U2 TaxID=933115 RepID=E7RKK5_9BACL|nr:hypothetical protein [Planococcus donghaensis]EGA88435.1 hypothetical protein GPDM_15149 [Planococcus donghaensis MPA1U2]